MTGICNICHELLSSPAGLEPDSFFNPQGHQVLMQQSGKSPGKDDQAKSIICALPCGHVYHKQCLSMWFEKPGAGVGKPRSKVIRKCPTCGKRSRYGTEIRIYFQQLPDEPLAGKPLIDSFQETEEVDSELSEDDTQSQEGTRKRMRNDITSLRQEFDKLKQENKLLRSKVSDLTSPKLNQVASETEQKTSGKFCIIL